MTRVFTGLFLVGMAFGAMSCAMGDGDDVAWNGNKLYGKESGGAAGAAKGGSGGSKSPSPGSGGGQQAGAGGSQNAGGGTAGAGGMAGAGGGGAAGSAGSAGNAGAAGSGGSGGGGGGGNGCSHDECTSGGAIDATCTACTSDVCGADPFCCSSQWDDTCIGEAQSLCGLCGGSGGSGGGGSGGGGTGGGGTGGGGGSGGSSGGSGGSPACDSTCQCAEQQSWPGILYSSALCNACLKYTCGDGFLAVELSCPSGLSGSCDTSCGADNTCWCGCMMQSGGACAIALESTYQCVYANCAFVCN